LKKINKWIIILLTLGVLNMGILAKFQFDANNIGLGIFFLVLAFIILAMVVYSRLRNRKIDRKERFKHREDIRE